MGIKDLWNILGPFCDRKPLYELQGKTVAIDLSCWICEAQNIAEYQVQPRMYLRNLYFRTCYLLLLEVNPVFVLDGKAPTLKYKTIAARNAIQFKGAKPKADVKTKPAKDRSRFSFVLKQCEEMLKCMGIACITGNGEAEALCAHLNEDGLVDGCITQDSDCFAYGAKTVYRNFSISQQGFHAAAGGAIDVYDIEKLTRNNGIGRNKIIALALLCGSDYNDGVFGVGKDSVIKLFNQVAEDKILDHLRSWRTNTTHYKSLEEKLADKTICTKCGHTGRLQSHNKNGCNVCNKATGCLETDFKEKQQSIKNELNMRKKALEDTAFPNEELIEEYLRRKDYVKTLNLRWSKPDMIKFINFTRNYLEWEELYSFEKLLPILTRWQLLNIKTIETQSTKNKEYLRDVLIPEYIKKIRNPKGIPSYEIIWSDKQDHFKDIIPREKLQCVDLVKLWSTIEPQELVEKAYPDVVEKFKESKAKPKKQSKRKPKEPSDKPKRIRKTKTTKEDIIPKQLTVDSYFKQALVNSMKETNDGASIPTTSSYLDLDLSNFWDEQDSDLSDIVEDIVTRGRPDYVDKHLKTINSEREKLNNSSFFITNCVEDDLFEQTFNISSSDVETEDSPKKSSDSDVSPGKSNNSSPVKNNTDSPEKNNEDANDSFFVNTDSLLDRIRNKTQIRNIQS